MAFERQSSHAVTPKILQEINTYPFKTNRTRDLDNTERRLEVRNRIRTLIFWSFRVFISVKESFLIISRSEILWHLFAPLSF